MVPDKVEKSFWGEKTNGGEPTSNLAITYSYKNWQFGVLGLFVFYPYGCVYKDELFNKYVQQKNKVRLADQGSMLVFRCQLELQRWPQIPYKAAVS